MTSQLLAAPRTHSRILGVGVHRPRRVVSNKEICEWIDSTEEWIETRSGIRSRRFAEKDETLAVMAVSAARSALRHAGVGAGEVDCVIVASMSNLVQTPPLAVTVAADLGATGSAGFDVSAACAGFCHALAIAGDMVSTRQARYVLVAGVERMTDIVDPADRGIAFLFADGAGAVVVGPSAAPGIGPVVRGADGSSRDALRMNTGWGAFRADPTLPPPRMKMDGRRVFRWAVEHAVPAGRRALELAGLAPGDLAAFVPHQANLRMIEILAARIGLPDHVAVADDVIMSGNTSAASIPLAMEALLRSGRAASGDAALLMGFGAGLNYAGQVVHLP
ncbi:beta-ketoacyl-ACP synthase 3 [Nonomuraea sp. NPDC003214]